MNHKNSMEFPTTKTSRFPVGAMIFYGIGEISITISMVLFGLFILFFYNSVMELPGVLVGIGSAVGLLWDAVLDPYIGHRSDRSQSRFGRRHSYMLFGACTMGVSFWLLLSPPRDLSVTYLFLWLLVATLLFRTASAIYRIPYLSLGAEFSSDYHERTVIVGVRSFFGLIGTLLAASLSFILFFPDSVPGVDPKLDYSGYPKMGLGFGLIMSVAGFVAVFGTMRYRISTQAAANKVTPQGRFFHGFLAALKNRSFRLAWSSYSLFLLAVVLTSVTSVHYYNWYAQLSESSTISRIQACFYVGALVGVFVWVWLSKRFDKHKLYIVSILCTATLLFGAYFLVGEGNLFGVGNAMPLYVGNALGGIFASAVWVLPGSMLADISDEDALSTGLRREGILFGIFNLGEKIAAGVSVLLGGLLVQHFVGLIPGTFEQSAVAQQRLGIVYGVVPAILLIGAAALVRGYRLDRNSLKEIQASLNQGAEGPHVR